MECGVKELSRNEGYSECEAYAWDMESNFRDSKTFQVRHWRDRKSGGGYLLTDERDIYEALANQGARRKRACMEAVIPRDVVDAAVNQCRVTLKTKADTGAESIAKMLEKFAEYGVTKAQIEARIQRHVDAITPALFVGLRRIYNSLKDGMSIPAEWFEAAAEAKETKGVAAMKAKVAEEKKDPTLDIPGAGPSEQSKKEPEEGPPKVEYTALLSRLQNAKNVEALDADATLIEEIPEIDRQNTLAKAYRARRSELEKK
jgi:hypothetical protein